MLGSALHIDGAPLPIRQPAPALGEHTADVLAELGYSAEDIDHFRRRGVA
jgi:crotonobetainyl-CoA:carnitine CoA-transferase CaiB-like acyl-CoA transferase